MGFVYSKIDFFENDFVTECGAKKMESLTGVAPV
jgi:hypothetical protein